MLYREFCGIMNYSEKDSYDDYGMFIRYINYCVNKYKDIPCFNCENFIKLYKNRIEDANYNFVCDSYKFNPIDKSLFGIYRTLNEEYECVDIKDKLAGLKPYYFESYIDGEYILACDLYNRKRLYFIEKEYIEDFRKFLTQDRDLCSLMCCDKNISPKDSKPTYFIYPEIKLIERNATDEYKAIVSFRTKTSKIPLRCGLFNKFIYPYPSDIYFSCKHWQDIRDHRKKIDLYKCQVCGKMETRKESLVIHHLTYERLGYEDIDDVITVCKSCHTAIHKEHQKEKKKKNLENVLEKMKNFKKKD